MGKWVYIPDGEEEAEQVLDRIYNGELEEIQDYQTPPDEDWIDEGYDIQNEDDWVLGKIPKPSKRVWFADCPKCGDKATYLEPDEFMDAMGCLECDCGHIRWPMTPQPTHSLFWPYEKE